MDLQLRGRTALVSGSHRGTGLIIAQHLAREGCRVLVHGLQPGQAEAAVRELETGIPVTGDITTDAGAAALLEQLRDETIDILVNNYGTADPGAWEETASDDWIVSYQKNVLSAQRLIRALLPQMRTRDRGRIINLGTVGSTRPGSTSPQYYAAKGALATMTISLAKEVAGSGIRVNLVSPGIILTPEVRDAYTARAARRGIDGDWAAIEADYAKDIPIRRMVRREEVADLVTFLASPLADAIHGQNIRIDGGALDILS